MKLAALVFAAHGLISTGDEVCAEIQMGDGQGRDFAALLEGAGSEAVEALFARVVDRLESRRCFTRSLELLDTLDAHLDGLLESDAKLRELSVRIDLVRARIELLRACPELSCAQECPGATALERFVGENSELPSATVETWLSEGQSEADGRALACALARVSTQPPPPPVLLPPPDLSSPDPEPARGWSATRRRNTIALSSVGLVLGAAAMITGGVFLALDESCPGGGLPTSCKRRFATNEEGILALSLGGAVVLGSTVGLSLSASRKPDPRYAGATSWSFALGWSGQF